MSISDLIVVMKEGVVQQIGRPQEVYDEPVNLFVAKFLGTPPINVFDGRIEGGKLCIGDDVLFEAKGAKDQPVTVGIRPEGFVLNENGVLGCRLSGVEVMGRDVSVVSTHPAAQGAAIRSIISAENRVDAGAQTVRFDLKSAKVFVFDRETGARMDVALS